MGTNFLPMPRCEFEQRPDIRWRRLYAKGASWSRKQKAERLLIAWCADKDSPKTKTVLAHRFLQKPRRAYSSLVEREFLRLSEEWKNDTMHWSSVTRMISHRNYLGIIGLAGRTSRHEVERLLLRELQKEPAHWFDALSAITGEDPVKQDYDFDQAVEAWLAWGREKGII